ncbi:hypothetical protein M9H77_17473 [Catharanthus roseus]|uniref:Uncharacterized protein n=1 Tax=Catharanthus roseus TaxID=4058 RepID=A0ACC0B4Q0_CATRO|nr:hypothetical protein M9H77_17473 [Catharanthus roseus]
MVLTVNMMRLGESVAPGGEVSKCDRLHRALSDCHQKIPPGPPRQAACRHLNRSLAECLVSVACPEESDAVRSLCSSSGTALKRHQCQQAQLSLSGIAFYTRSKFCLYVCEADWIVNCHLKGETTLVPSLIDLRDSFCVTTR